MGEHERFGASLESEYPHAVIALVLELSQVRAHHMVGRALADRYPTESEWMALLNSPEFLELVEEVAVGAERLRMVLSAGAVANPEVIQRVFAGHYQESLIAVAGFADHIGVPPEDVLAVICNTEGRLAGKSTDAELWALKDRVRALEDREGGDGGTGRDGVAGGPARDGES